MGKLMLALSAASIITSFIAKDGDRPKAEKAHEVITTVQTVVDRIKRVREPDVIETKPLERVLSLMQRFQGTQQTVPIPPPFDPTNPQPLTPT